MARFKTNTRATAMEWHSPLCSVCKEPIHDMHDALATWFIARNHETYSPMIIHNVSCYRRLRDTDHFLNTIPVEAYRRCPLEAIVVAMRRRSTSEAERLVWHSWLSGVLGLPVGDESNLLPGGDAPSELHDHVLTIEEARRITGETI
jgi:hypothetical protein